jgi:hypothetical protein
MDVEMKLCNSLKGNWEKDEYIELYKGEDRIIIWSRTGALEKGEGGALEKN